MLWSSLVAKGINQLMVGSSVYLLIVGLDSAYYADEWALYREGSLSRNGKGTEQLDFLRAQAAKKKKIILLTHHNGLEEDGSSKTALWTQVMSAFPNGCGLDYWYWGHMHAVSGMTHRKLALSRFSVGVVDTGRYPAVRLPSWRTTRTSYGMSDVRLEILIFRIVFLTALR